MYSNKHVSLTYILRKFFFVFCLGAIYLKFLMIFIFYTTLKEGKMYNTKASDFLSML